MSVAFVGDLTKEVAGQRWVEVCSDAKFTDEGSQLGKILGDTKDYCSEKLRGKMKVFHTLAS